MYTEAEAKTKWCPLARASDLGGAPVAINRSGKRPDNDCLCLASDCMAWQAEPLEYEDGEPLPFGATPDGSGWEKNGETWYCGPGVTGEKRQCWRKPLPITGYCGAFAKAGAA